MLIEKTLYEPFIYFSNILKNNSAVELRVKRNGTDNIDPYTTATTMNAGWRQKIPLYERNGYGYVYSDEYLTLAEAEKELRLSIPYQNNDSEANHIKMRIGRSKKSWVNNCVAVELASAFVESFEFTGIFFIQHGIEQLVKFALITNFQNHFRKNIIHE